MHKWLLIGICIVGLVARIIGLTTHPTGFTPDEASFGYDAYSLLKTGKDQWGKSWPLVFESFGDYKSPLYTYLTVPFIFLFGLTKFAVRLPNALLGSFAVVVVYLLSKKLFKKEGVALFASLMLAISPWHIMLSRGAFEANLTTFFLPLGVLFFLNKKFSLAAIIMGLNLFSYHSAKVVTPFILLTLVVLQWQELKGYLIKPNKDILVAIIAFSGFILLTVYTFFAGAGARVAERSITQGALEEAFNQRKSLYGTQVYALSRIFHNKYLVFVERFAGNYVTYLSPQFLFANGPNEATYGMIPGRGVLYWFSILFVLFLGKAFSKDDNKSARKWLVFLVLWMLLSVIPTSLATGVGYSANRAAIMMPSIEILLGVGAYYFFTFLKKYKLVIYVFSLVMFISVVFFLEDYFIESQHKTAKAMLYGRLEALEKLPNDGNKVIVDKSLSEPHIYTAFAQRIDPAVYQNYSKDWRYKESDVNWVDQMPEYKLGKYTFKDIEGDDLAEDTYLIGKIDDFQGMTVTTLETINYPNGDPAVVIVSK